MLFVLHCIDRPGDGAAIRRRTRAAHFRYLMAHQEQFHFGGPLLDERDGMIGSLMVLNLPDRAALDTFMRTEPYCASGLFASISVHQTKQMFPEATPGALAAELAKQSAGAA